MLCTIPDGSGEDVKCTVVIHSSYKVMAEVVTAPPILLTDAVCKLATLKGKTYEVIIVSHCLSLSTSSFVTLSRPIRLPSFLPRSLVFGLHKLNAD